MSIWYAFCDFLPLEMLHWDFMKNAMLAVLLMGPLFGLCSTMVVTGRMSFFSDALGHSAFTGIAIGSLAGMAAPTWAAVAFSVCFALLFSYVRSRSNQTADTLIGVFSSTAVALGIFVATLGAAASPSTTPIWWAMCSASPPVRLGFWLLYWLRLFFSGCCAATV